MSHHILVVDDEPSVRGVVEAVLFADGFDVTTVRDGEEALDAMEERLPDAVVLDLMMPAMTGWEVLDEIRRDPRHQHSRVPVLVLTAKATDWDRDRTTAADHFMSKPFEPDELVQTLTRLIAAKAS
ncbi:putative transcriptional regulator ycf27 (plasmid) [Euzebya pacifica]|uniref:Putative transcriptional regulator ycf27 n=1 Tax=Euzebya pacifica TaxID=1608957 RepID=A0A346Y6E3_9ACTN|nr:response regulator [Euzebya pacifica]AXV10040.1 putative transcriptional regulator ycf27 [Euzebya pacifica]